MNRHLWVVALATLFGASPMSHAQQPPQQQQPNRPATHAAPLDKAAQPYMECAVHCMACSRHCAEMAADGKKDMLKTMQLCEDCAAVCGVGARLAFFKSPVANIYAESCGKVCETCAQACEKMPTDEMMAACAKSCRDCAKHCREMMTSKTGANGNDQR